MIDNTIPEIPVSLDRLLEEARLKSAIVRDHVQDLKDLGITEIWLGG
ncbi:hypothetical protein VB711_19705 [Cronbergia sp. UHCC 0137]|nr:hypothetical protein [Cronbergia sp. UHCC 0137]MEA5620054.1 hypothetical protein [Cronbergia sp. UHCC 0137]